MSTRTAFARRLTGVAGFVAGLVTLGHVAPASAQGASTDPRWQAWLGCWEVAVPESLPTIATVNTPRICVIPSSGASAVDIVTVVGDSVASRQHIEATGEQRDVTRDGCTGWERAQWSPNGQRLYLRASYACGAGLTRLTNGVIAMSATGEWLDVQGVVVGTSVGVRAARYRDATNTAALPAEVAAALEGRPRGMNVAKIAAAAQLTTADVVEATRFLDAGVVETWLAERGQGFGLDARKLIELEKAQVPSTVIDVMVALSYPTVFALDRSRLGETRAAENADNANQHVVYAGTMYGDARDYGYSPYGYRYGYGYGNGYGYGWYPGNRPIIVVTQPPSDGTSADKHGKVVKGRGYTADGSRAGTTGSGSGSGSAAKGSSGGSSTSTGGSSSDKGSSSGRTAKPRPPKG